MRGEGGGAAGAGVVFRNINIEDPRPPLPQFFLSRIRLSPSKDVTKGVLPKAKAVLLGKIFGESFESEKRNRM